MRKFYYILPCLALSLILLFSNSSFTFAKTVSNPFIGENYYYIFPAGEEHHLRVTAGVKQKNTPLETYVYDYKITCDSDVLVFACSNGGIRNNDSNFEPYSNNYLRFVSNDKIDIIRTTITNGQIYDVGSSNYGRDYYQGSDYFYAMYSAGYIFSYESGLNVSNTTLYKNTVSEFLSGDLPVIISPDELGGINNPENNPAIGNLKNMQSSAIDLKYQTWDANGKQVSTSFDLVFKWDNVTTNNYQLNDYSIQYFGNGDLNYRGQGGSIQQKHVSFNDNEGNFNKTFNNTYTFTIPWMDILDVANVPYNNNVNSNLSGAGLMPIAYNSPNFTFYFRPVLNINGKYYAGGWTKLNLNYNHEDNTGSISTENVDIDTGGISSSTNQTGTGSNFTPVIGDGTNSFGGNLPNVDFDGVRSVLSDLQKTVGLVPQVLGTMVSFLPSWLINLIIVGLGLMVAVGLFKFVVGALL